VKPCFLLLDFFYLLSFLLVFFISFPTLEFLRSFWLSLLHPLQPELDASCPPHIIARLLLFDRGFALLTVLIGTQTASSRKPRTGPSLPKLLESIQESSRRPELSRNKELLAANQSTKALVI
jgi:hypothetical protein